MSESEKNDQSDPEPSIEAAEAQPDQKAAFKAALDKKNAAARARSEHLDGDNRVAGSSHPGANKRMFRRKSGG